MQVTLNPKKPPAPRQDISDFQNFKSVLQVVRQKYGIADDLRPIQWATHIFCFIQLVNLCSAVEQENQDALKFY